MRIPEFYLDGRRSPFGIGLHAYYDGDITIAASRFVSAQRIGSPRTGAGWDVWLGRWHIIVDWPTAASRAWLAAQRRQQGAQEEAEWSGDEEGLAVA